MGLLIGREGDGLVVVFRDGGRIFVDYFGSVRERRE